MLKINTFNGPNSEHSVNLPSGISVGIQATSIITSDNRYQINFHVFEFMNDIKPEPVTDKPVADISEAMIIAINFRN